MGKTTGGFYAVARGRKVGIFNSWNQCKEQVDGFANARFKKFSTLVEAEQFVNKNCKNDLRNDASTTTIHHPKAPPSKLSVSFKNNSAKYSKKFSTSAAAATVEKKAMAATYTAVNNRAKSGSSAVTVAQPEDFDYDDNGYVIVYTDGACTSNGRRGARAGIGVWFGNNSKLNISEPVKGRQTNNTAEIQAAYKAIQAAKRAGISKLNVMTDSQFTINCITKWINGWRRNGWKLRNGEPVKNMEDLILLDESIKGINIKWTYVKGHAGHFGNEMADQLAVKGAEKITL